MDNYKKISRYYEDYDEENRLLRRSGQAEYRTTMHYIHRYLTPGDRILEVGAGTGRYSLALAAEGYDVTAIELTEHNLTLLCAKITPDMNIRAVHGNALDLFGLKDETFDMTLILGPMYHLSTEADMHQAMGEALRVTRTGGIVMAAYCVNDGPVITYIFRNGKYAQMVADGVLDPDNFHLRTTDRFLFRHITKEELDRFMESFPVERLHYVATDGLPCFLLREIDDMDEASFDALLRYHLTICEREDLIGATAHSLDIFRKKPEG